MTDASLRAATCWTSPEAIEDIGPQVIGEKRARDDADENGLTIIGAIDVAVLDDRDSVIPSHPEGLPMYVRANYLAVPAAQRPPATTS